MRLFKVNGGGRGEKGAAEAGAGAGLPSPLPAWAKGGGSLLGPHPPTPGGAGYSRLTFMLPKAEGCCTGLQLSAKEVVLGRPDMVSPALPQRRSPLSSSCLRPPPRPGGPACRSLARSAAGDGRDAPHETPGPPLPPPGEAPSPLGLCRPAAAAASSSPPPASSCSSSRRPLLTRPSFPAAPVGPRAASPRRRCRARGVRWASLPPPRAPVTWGGGSRPGSSDPAAAAFLSFYLLYLFFSPLLLFLPSLPSPLPVPLLPPRL